MNPGDAPAIILVIVIVMTLGVFVVMGFLLLCGRAWIQALLSGVPLSLFTVVGMRLRRTDAGAVIRALIAARQGGLFLSCREVESAHLQGVDLEKVVLAMVEAKRRGMDVTFQELVNAERQHRLEEKLKW